MLCIVMFENTNNHFDKKFISNSYKFKNLDATFKYLYMTIKYFCIRGTISRFLFLKLFLSK
eukprot:UN19507